VISICAISHPSEFAGGVGCFSSIMFHPCALLLPYRSCYLLSESVRSYVSPHLLPKLDRLGFRSLVDPTSGTRVAKPAYFLGLHRRRGLRKRYKDSALSVVPDKAKLLMEDDDDDDANELCLRRRSRAIRQVAISPRTLIESLSIADLHEQQAALFPAKPTFTALILELPA
jgi:hypothetical protein